jgi:hypothetical protein
MSLKRKDGIEEESSFKTKENNLILGFPRIDGWMRIHNSKYPKIFFVIEG